MGNKIILDCTCGSRMFWFDKQNPNVLFTDIREVSDTLCDGRKLEIHPDQIEDFTKLSFSDKSFKMVVFDPPHLRRVGETSYMGKKYGRLPKNWGEYINQGIHECMRVLDDFGVLIFKWNQSQIKAKVILQHITDYKPLMGHTTNVSGNTIWMVFMKMPTDKITEK